MAKGKNGEQCEFFDAYFFSGKCQRCKHRGECGKIVGKRLAKRLVCIAIVLAVLFCTNAMFHNYSAKENTEQVGFNSGPEDVEEVSISATPPAYENENSRYTVVYDISYEEQIAIAKMVLGESENQGKSIKKFYGVENPDPSVMTDAKEIERLRTKIAVAANPFNRLETGSTEFYDPNKWKECCILAILDKPYAYTTRCSWMTDKEFLAHPLADDCMKAVWYAMCGVDPTEEVFGEEGGARFFFSKPLTETAAAAREGVKTMQIEDMYFHNDFAK